MQGLELVPVQGPELVQELVPVRELVPEVPRPTVPSLLFSRILRWYQALVSEHYHRRGLWRQLFLVPLVPQLW